jgi:hypothetical protein
VTKKETRVDDTQYAKPLATASENQPEPFRSLCACISDDAERCIALRYPDAPDLTDDGEPERCGCSCHDFARYDE